MEPRALDVVVNKVVLNMDSLKVVRILIAKVTPEYLQAFYLKKTILDVLTMAAQNPADWCRQPRVRRRAQIRW